MKASALLKNIIVTMCPRPTAFYRNFCWGLEKRLLHCWFCFWRNVFRLCYLKGFFFLQRNSFLSWKQNNWPNIGYSTVQAIFLSFFKHIHGVLSLQQTYRFKPFHSIHIEDKKEMQKLQLGEISGFFSLSQPLLSNMQLRFDLFIRIR